MHEDGTIPQSMAILIHACVWVGGEVSGDLWAIPFNRGTPMDDFLVSVRGG